jgi:hypothetical protein
MPRHPHPVSRACAALLACLPALLPAQTSQRLGNPEPGVNDRFGSAVASDGRWLLVGAPLDDSAAGADAGAVFVFERVNGQYLAHSRLNASDGAAGDRFGSAVVVVGGSAIIGAENDNLTAGSGAGSAYVFSLTGSDWTQTGKLSAPDAATGDAFGSALALDGEVLLVGALSDDLTSLPDAGSAYLFLRSGNTWRFASKLVAPDATPSDRFGAAVAVAGDHLLVGARNADNDAGVVYAFRRDGLQAAFRQRLAAADRGPADRFGIALAIEGELLLVGADQHAGTLGNNAGAAYLYQHLAGSWQPLHKLQAPGLTADSRSGRTVALRGGVALLGAPTARVGECCDQGAIDLFLRSGSRWRFERRLQAADGAPFDTLGSALAFAGDDAMAGAPTANDRGGGQLDAGSVLHLVATWPQFRDGFEPAP